jgi:hypothetical protein
LACGAAPAPGLELRVLRVGTVEALTEALAREAGERSERTEAVLTLHGGFMSIQQQQT